MRKREVAPFVLALTFFVLGFVGLLLGIWPNLVAADLRSGRPPHHPPVRDSFSSAPLIMLPAVLGYTWWSYSVFRGKVTADVAYR